MTDEQKRDLLYELEENLLNDGINFYDLSVGWEKVTDLNQWVKEEASEIESINILEHSEDQVIFECEGVKFEIYELIHLDGLEVIESSWGIRFYTE